MENLKQCRIVLEQITEGNNVNTKLSIPNRGKSQEKNDDKFCNPSELTPIRNNFTKICLTPCFIKLENINIANGNKPEKSNMINTPPVTSSFKEPAETNIKQGKTDVPFEPVTPKAHIEFSLELKKVINERNILTSKTKKHVFDALDEIKNKTEEERRSFKREQALLEIINSEIKYVHQLEIIINFFMKPIKERKLLKPDDYGILFSNINTIYNVNKELLDELDKGVENITNAFSKIAPFLKLYSVYAYEFKSSLKILQVIIIYTLVPCKPRLYNLFFRMQDC